MDYSDYIKNVQSKFNANTPIPELNAVSFYEDVLKAKWLATKMKIYSFVSYSEVIDKKTIDDYSSKCFQYAIHNYKGLPRGFQNSVASFNVLAGKEVDNNAVFFDLSKPSLHFAAFEMPVIVDLKAEKVHYFTKTPMWGAIYYKYLRNYINDNFSL